MCVRVCECVCVCFILGVREITHKSNDPHGRRVECVRRRRRGEGGIRQVFGRAPRLIYEPATPLENANYLIPHILYIYIYVYILGTRPRLHHAAYCRGAGHDAFRSEWGLLYYADDLFLYAFIIIIIIGVVVIVFVSSYDIIQY